MAKGTQHLVIRARAGTGKTATIIDFVNYCIDSKYKPAYEPTDEQKEIHKKVPSGVEKIIYCAFNKSIAEEVQSKLPEGVEAKTLHSLGYSYLKSHFGKLKLSGDQNSFRMKELLGYKFKDRMSRDHFLLTTKVCKVVSLLKNFLLEGTKENICQLVNHFGIDVNGSLDQVCKFAPQLLEASHEHSGEIKYIDFDDMIYLPAKLGLVKKSFDLLIVDEAQDLNPAQHELVVRGAKQVLAVGDDKQAIYGFRGSDSNSINNLIDKLDGDVEEFPLTVTWRCPTSHVDAINNLVPDLKAAPSAIEGEIKNIDGDKIFENLSGEKSLVMCRTNAPLCQLAFQLIQRGTPCRIQGRDFGQGLISLIKKLDAKDIESLLEKLANYEDREEARINKQNQFSAETAIQLLHDKCLCVKSLSEGVTETKYLIARIESLFDSSVRKDQVLLSSGHRAKGLEADDIFILRPDLLPHPMAKQPWEQEQENNLYYVIHTRGMKRKFIVNPKNES